MPRPGIQVEEDDDVGIASLSLPPRSYPEESSNTRNTYPSEEGRMVGDDGKRKSEENQDNSEMTINASGKDDVSTTAKATSTKEKVGRSFKGKPDDGDDTSMPPARRLASAGNDSYPSAEAVASSEIEGKAVEVSISGATEDKVMPSRRQDTTPSNEMDEKKNANKPPAVAFINPGAIPVPATTQMSDRNDKEGQSNSKLTLLAGSSPQRRNAPSYIFADETSNFDNTVETSPPLATADQNLDTDAFDFKTKTGNQTADEPQPLDEPISHEDNIVELVANQIRDRLFQDNTEIQNAELVAAETNTDVENGLSRDTENVGSKKEDNASDPCYNKCWMVLACFVLVAGIVGAVLGVVLSGGGSAAKQTTTLPPTYPVTTLPPSTRAPTLTPTEGIEARRESLLAILASSFGVNETSDEEWWEVFDDPSTPQAKAVTWMTENDQTTADLLSQESVEATLFDRYATVLVYFSMAGPEWSIDFPFLNGATSVCQWNNGRSGTEKEGIFCADATNYDVVTEVFLQELNLTGTIPWEPISSLRQLSTLYMFENLLTGSLPELSNLSKLTALGISSNFLTGSLPSNMPGNLEFLNLFNNTLTGTLPSEWSTALTSLTFLNLGMNQIEGAIPWHPFPAWGKLTTLYVHTNKLRGPMPTQLDNLSSLRFLSLSANSLTGTLSTDMPHTLEHLYLYENSLNGSLPELSNLSKLTELGISSNFLTGSLPSNMPGNLEFLNLFNNTLTGTLPSEWSTALTSLTFLNLGMNQIEGAIPWDPFPAWGKLTTLYVHDNTLTGPMPTQLDNLSSLRFLALASNSLTGTLSTDMPHTLEHLYLFETDLSGTIPDTWANTMSNLMVLDLGTSGLQGTIPTSLGTLTELTRLNLNTNVLTGTLPTQLGELSSSLEILHVQSNPLTGSVPIEYSHLSLLTSLKLHDTFLTGSVVDSIFCTWNEPPMDMWSDCLGESPEMMCTCCSWCCSENGTGCLEM